MWCRGRCPRPVSLRRFIPELYHKTGWRHVPGELQDCKVSTEATLRRTEFIAFAWKRQGDGINSCPQMDFAVLLCHARSINGYHHATRSKLGTTSAGGVAAGEFSWVRELIHIAYPGLRQSLARPRFRHRSAEKKSHTGRQNLTNIGALFGTQFTEIGVRSDQFAFFLNRVNPACRSDRLVTGDVVEDLRHIGRRTRKIGQSP